MNRRLAAVSLLALLPACTSRPLDGPPQLRVGRDQCAECGMIISDDRCAAALLIEEKGGYREHELFDDLGCLLDRLKALPTERRVVGVFVRDHADHCWLTASGAWIVSDTGTHTPMGSGLVAVGDRAAAERLAGEGKGHVTAGSDLSTLHNR